MKATARTVLPQPIEDVWAYVSRVEHMADWVDGVSDVRRSDEVLSVGARFSSDYEYRGETFDVTYEVTAWEPPNRLDVRSVEGPFPFSGSIRLEADGDRTLVSNTIDAASDGRATTVIFALLGPVLRRLMRRRLSRELEALESAVGSASVAA